MGRLRHGTSGCAGLLLAALALLVPTRVAAQQPVDAGEIEQRVAVIRKQIAELEDTRNKIVKEGHVLLEWGAAVVLVERARVENLFIILLREGKMDLEQVEPTARHVGRMTGIYVTEIIDPELTGARRELAELEARIRAQGTTTSRPAAGLVAQWPDPMDWRRVRGVAAGTFVVRCDHDGKELLPEEGTFRLELTGQGTITGSILSGTYEYPVHGTIDANGNAMGGGAGALGSQYSWTVKFARSGDYLVMSSHTLTLVLGFEGSTCRPGYIRQQ